MHVAHAHAHVLTQSLRIILEEQLFKLGGYSTFVEYVDSSPDLLMSSRHAYRLVAAARLCGALPPGSLLPSNESQVRPLSACKLHTAVAAWQLAVIKAGNQTVTALLVRECLGIMQQQGAVGGSSNQESGSKSDTCSEGSDMEAGRAPSVLFSTASCEWYSPVHFIVRVLQVWCVGGIDLDPASCAEANA